MTYEADLIAHYKEVRKRLSPQVIRPVIIKIRHEEIIEPIPVIVKPFIIINPRVRAKVPYIARFVADHYKVSLGDLFSHSRKGPLTLVRHIAMWMCCTCEKQALARVGKQFRRDHTSVLHARNRIQRMIDKDPEFNSEIRALVRKLHELPPTTGKWKNGGIRHGLAD